MTATSATRRITPTTAIIEHFFLDGLAYKIKTYNNKTIKSQVTPRSVTKNDLTYILLSSQAETLRLSMRRELERQTVAKV